LDGLKSKEYKVFLTNNEAYSLIRGDIIKSMQQRLHNVLNEFNRMHEGAVRAVIVRFESSDIVIGLSFMEYDSCSVNDHVNTIKNLIEKEINSSIEIGEISDTGKSYIVRYIIKGR